MAHEKTVTTLLHVASAAAFVCLQACGSTDAGSGSGAGPYGGPAASNGAGSGAPTGDGYGDHEHDHGTTDDGGAPVVSGDGDELEGSATFGALEASKLAPEANERVFIAHLNGAQEVADPAIATPASGTMVLFLNQAGTELRFALFQNVADATLAHLHIGAGGENGAVALPIPQFKGESLTTGTLTVTEAQVRDLEAGRLYANVHSKVNTKGEIRGQVLRPGETLFVAQLNGAQEVPVIPTAAKGTGSLIVDPAHKSVRFRVVTDGIVRTLTHIHRGIGGVPGPVVYDLKTSATEAIEGTQAITAADIDDLRLRKWYFNVHSAANVKGEIRGQILRPGETLFTSSFSGAQETPPNASTGTGAGMIVLGAARDRFRFATVTDIGAPAFAHIHRGAVGVAGPVVFDLPKGTDAGVLTINAEQLAGLTAGELYFNVHKAEDAKAEIRGQIVRPGAK
jgi:hypothetical protein